jgi:hypothetical protein
MLGLHQHRSIIGGPFETLLRQGDRDSIGALLGFALKVLVLSGGFAPSASLALLAHLGLRYHIQIFSLAVLGLIAAGYWPLLLGTANRAVNRYLLSRFVPTLLE